MLRATPLTTAYNVLLEKQEELGRYLTYDEVRSKLESTPGVVFNPGTTFEDVLAKLQGYNFISVDKIKQRVFVFSKSKPPVKKDLQSITEDQEGMPGGRPGGAATLYFG